MCGVRARCVFHSWNETLLCYFFIDFSVSICGCVVFVSFSYTLPSYFVYRICCDSECWILFFFRSLVGYLNCHIFTAIDICQLVFFFLVFHSFRFIVCFSSRHSLHDYCHITFDAILFMIVVDRVDICCCLRLYICLIKVIESLEIWTNNFNHLKYNWLAYYISKAPHYWYLRSWNWIQIERFNSLGNLWPKKLPFFYWHSSSSSTTQPRKYRFTL